MMQWSDHKFVNTEAQAFSPVKLLSLPTGSADGQGRHVRRRAARDAEPAARPRQRRRARGRVAVAGGESAARGASGRGAGAGGSCGARELLALAAALPAGEAGVLGAGAGLGAHGRRAAATDAAAAAAPRAVPEAGAGPVALQALDAVGGDAGAVRGGRAIAAEAAAAVRWCAGGAERGGIRSGGSRGSAAREESSDGGFDPQAQEGGGDGGRRGQGGGGEVLRHVAGLERERHEGRGADGAGGTAGRLQTEDIEAVGPAPGGAGARERREPSAHDGQLGSVPRVRDCGVCCAWRQQELAEAAVASEQLAELPPGGVHLLSATA
ncbi:unnamed protein product [Phytophthora fragariaefolia]|uniref:Unnamed protein product n=1 Tax=Phytophthora fragariaefolia TaxID=1490495 RepID=A0A9W6XYV1_9STRA|nr:unnamed protein product [Phytophthora fragariaefolia]